MGHTASDSPISMGGGDLSLPRQSVQQECGRGEEEDMWVWARVSLDVPDSGNQAPVGWSLLGCFGVTDMLPVEGACHFLHSGWWGWRGGSADKSCSAR